MSKIIDLPPVGLRADGLKAGGWWHAADDSKLDDSPVRSRLREKSSWSVPARRDFIAVFRCRGATFFLSLAVGEKVAPRRMKAAMNRRTPQVKT